MSYAVNVGDAATLKNILPTASRSSDANGSAVDLNGLEGEAIVILDAPAGSGNQTLDVKLQQSADGSTSWTDVTGGAFTQVTTTASQQKLSINISEIKRYVRGVTDVGGTSPDYTFSVNLIGFNKYPS